MTRSHVLLSTLLLLSFPLHASQKAKFLAHTKQTCSANSANDRQYQIQYRAVRWIDQGKEVYTSAVGYYVPGSGEFLWWGTVSPPKKHI